MPERRRPRRLGLELGRRLRAARLSAAGGRGLGQAQVAANLGISQAAVSDYERGRRRPPLETLATMADIYGVPVGWLVTGLQESRRAACGGGRVPETGSAHLSAAQSRVLREPLAELLDLELVTFLGSAGTAVGGDHEPASLQAAEERLPYATIAPAAEGETFLLAKRLSYGAKSAVLYVGSEAGPVAPGDLLLIAPQPGDGRRWRLAAEDGGDSGPVRYHLLPPGSSPSAAGLRVCGTVVGLLRHPD